MSEAVSETTETEQPAERPEMDPAALQAEVDKWKSLSRKNEDTAKANATKAKEYDAYLLSQKTEQERAAEERKQIETERDSSQVELAKLRAAMKHGLTEDDLDLLGHGTPEQIEERAEKLAARLNTRPAAKPDPHLGRETKPEGAGSGDWLRDKLNP